MMALVSFMENPFFIAAIGLIVVIGTILFARLPPFLCLLAGALAISCLLPDKPGSHPFSRVTAALGDGCGKLAVMIALAAIIGRALLDSGGAHVLVQQIRKLLGEKGTPFAFAISGFILGIPVFFDTVFYLMMPLGVALYRKTGRDYLLYILSVIAGATMAHSLVPPTPGPLMVANELQVPLAEMMIGGILVGLPAIAAGFVFAYWANRRWTIPLREGCALSSVSHAEPAGQPEIASRLPPLWFALLPLLVPLGLIAASSIAKVAENQPHWLFLLGEQNTALGLGALFSLILLCMYDQGQGKRATRIHDALTSAAGIILITAAGSAFGKMLEQTGIGERMAAVSLLQGHGLLWLAFGLTALIRIAQGSATVAMMTSVGIVAPLLTSATLPYPAVFLALAIGCGSKPGPWMNDSGFWIISRMTGMTTAETLKTFTVQLTIMGVAGMAAVQIGALIWDIYQ